MIELYIFATPRHVVYWNKITKVDGDDRFFGTSHVEDHDVMSAMPYGERRGTMQDGKSWLVQGPMMGRNDAHGEPVDYRLVSDEGVSICMFERTAEDLRPSGAAEWVIEKALANEGRILKTVLKFSPEPKGDLPVEFVDTPAWRELRNANLS